MLLELFLFCKINKTMCQQSHVRYHSSQYVRDFFTPTSSPFFSSFPLSFPSLFFGKEGERLPAERGISPRCLHVSNATIYVSRRDFPLHRRTSVADCGIYARSGLTILSTAIPRWWFTCFASRIQRDRRYRRILCESIARRNLINLYLRR